MAIHDCAPATLVIGLAGAGKSSYIRLLLAARPAAQAWLWLNNDRPLAAGDVPCDPDDGPKTGLQIADLSIGCACCAALPVLRARLPRLLAARPRDRVFIELASSGDPAAMVDALRQPELARWLRVDQIVLVIAAQSAPAYRVSSCAGDAPGTQTVSAAVTLLARRQLEAADLVCLTGHRALAGGELAGLVADLASSAPFGRPVTLAGEPGAPTWPALLSAPAGAARLLWDRRWPADCRFDRRRLVSALNDSADWPDNLLLVGVFATERAWYQMRRQGGKFTSEVSAYRHENRLQAFLSPDSWQNAPDTLASPESLADCLVRLGQAIEAARSG